MAKFRVVWRIELEKEVEAKDGKEALDIIENIDCQHEGNYIEDSFEFVDYQQV